MAKVFLFAYGTIQPGHGNFRDGLNVGGMFPGSVHGRIYWCGGVGSYPVAKLVPFEDNPVRGEEDKIVYGTWISVDPESEVFKSVTRMEVGAGYRVITVRDALTGIVGIAYHYNYEPDPALEIESGDWAKEISRSDLYS